MMATSSDAAGEGGDEAEQRADAERQRHHDGADQQRQAGAVDQAGEDVAAEAVGAERESRGR